MLAKLFRSTAALGALGLLSACTESNSSAPPAAPPPTPVSFIEAVPQDLPIVNELPGRVAPTRIAEVRPRVSGIVVARVFEQGSRVRAGDVLYRIDRAPFQVQVDSAGATLQRAEAAQLQARQASNRQGELYRRQISSAAQQESAVAALAQADADVAAARANLAAARLNLEYADVRAPIDGIIGRAAVTEGALVGSTENLATIQQYDPVYVDFTQSSGDLLALKRLAETEGEASRPPEAIVRIRLDDGSDYASPGRFLFSEATVDATTGQVTLRAEVPNPKGDLLPGMYVRVRIEQGMDRRAFSVPLQAVQRDAGGRPQIYLVTADDKAALRTVRTGRSAGDQVVIEEGLQAGDRVVVEGFQKIRPDAALRPEPWRKSEPADALAAIAAPAR